MRLFHISENADIGAFDPRESQVNSASSSEVVWAVDEVHLVNYLLPRDCPRVAFYPLPGSKAADLDFLLGPSGSRHVVAIERAWFRRVVACALWLYEFADTDFEVVDPGAGYFVSRRSQVPIAKHKVEYPVDAILERHAEFRVVSSLWPLRDAVVRSSLQFSCIRMRNALPR